MAVHDRTYMREQEPWRERTPLPVVIWIVIAYVGGMLVHAAATHWFRVPLDDWTLLTWYGLKAGRLWTVLTYPLYDSIEHISLAWLFNVGFAYVFGKQLEEWHGRERAVQFYAAALLFGAVAFAVAGATGLTRRLGGDPAFAIWGMVSATIAYAAFHAPRQRMHLFFMEVPLWVVALIWFAISLVGLFGLTLRGIYRLWPDVGGALFGIACWKLGVPDVRAWVERSRRKRAAHAAKKTAEERADVQTRVDALLDKIASDGMNSLTAEERDFLNRASKRY